MVPACLKPVLAGLSPSLADPLSGSKEPNLAKSLNQASQAHYQACWSELWPSKPMQEVNLVMPLIKPVTDKLSGQN